MGCDIAEERLLPLREKVPVGLARSADEGEKHNVSTAFIPSPLTRPSAKAEGHPLPQGERARAHCL
jgi:hypothetical protein